MITVDAITFWGVVALAVIGWLRSTYDVFLKKDESKESKHWAKSTQPDAPEGFAWVLVKIGDLPPK